ncbi:AI-2E family transporter [Pseudoflavonifractor sp. 524-17]|uniref:AI-2E family transporter n=1 Tax=Pseudoflavonifractor sp. 524-17 TaxID=2304577 RepID=UPI001379BD7D|nr:AI-2E family transporter [Pseudoflavonifractor sp. 524-17]NCE66092.1 AI-2E family transporter [Pseudoflavonifractor sp. 524-17]
MKNRENEKYVKLGITGVVVVIISLLCFFVLFRLPVILAFFQTVGKILTPFLYGAVIAYILAPICNRLEGWIGKCLPKRKRFVGTLSILLTLLFALLLAVALVVLVLPQFWESIVGILSALPAQIENAIDWFHNLLADQPELQTWWDGFSSKAILKFESWVKTDLLPTAQAVLNGLGIQVAGIFRIVKNLFLGILISAYLLAGRKTFAIQAKLLLCGVFPRRWADMVEKEVRYTDRMFNGFLMGKLLDSAIIGLICFAAVSIMRFESAAFISVVVGVTNIILFFGPFIGAIPCALLLLLVNPAHCLIFLVFIIILQQVDGNLIGPKILGNTTGLSSFWVLFSILLFGGLWGITGMI